MRAICAAFLIFLDLINVIDSGEEQTHNMSYCVKEPYFGELILIVFVGYYLECTT
jgi:hypothetical protein